MILQLLIINTMNPLNIHLVYNKMNYKELLIKYIANIGMSEGIDYVISTNISPAGGLEEMEFSEKDKEILNNEIFPEVIKWYNKD